MSLPIFYHPEITGGLLITVSEETSKHVVQVLRMQPGELLHLTDGQGNLYTCSIKDAHKKSCTVFIKDKNFTPKNEQRVCIAISVLKNANRFEWFLEKATEIGVNEIIPMLCHRTERQHFRYDRMQHILVSAMLQSQQVWLPKLHEPTKFENVIAASDFKTKLVAHCEEEKKFSLGDYANERAVQILIGPEGDFSADEISAALATGYQPVTLGNTRLRAETAGVAAACLLCIK
jgi:16S rRNA (uracil1498-N3)-methyltransferase